ncbi:MAG: UxaA family hydrolase [Coriobacteriales bacterium]|nr:UxaA family hydrolase [Coriobacteriales bacterium]
MAEEAIAIQAKPEDNVATIFADGIVSGTEVVVLDPSGTRTPFVVRGNVPYGHKFALRNIACGEQITKYGEEIGVATRDICAGDYVHVHNLDSMRGRGDLEKEA